jgi:hypothetical protein
MSDKGGSYTGLAYPAVNRKEGKAVAGLLRVV